MEKVNETNKSTDNTTENKTVEEKTTKAKKVIVKKPTRSIDDVSPNERVAIDNLCDWDVSFVSEETGKDILIAGSVKDFKRLTVAEVDAQVKIGNIAFCGVDDCGSHAMFRIKDPVIREYVFGEDISPTQLTEQSIKDLLNIENKKEFEKVLSDLVVTKSEKRMIVRICERIGIDDVPSFKLSAIEKISGIKFE